MSSENMEIRKLRPGELYNLSNILSISDSWKKLMAIVPNQENVPKFNSDHIRIIETVCKDRNAAEVFLSEWSTMGRERPTLKLLLDLLIKAELFRAADYVACDILKQEKPKRPNYGPAAPIDISDTAINGLLGKHQIVSQDPNSIIVESTSEFTSEINKVYSGDNTNKAINENILNPNNIDAEKSDFIKFSVTDICEEEMKKESLEKSLDVKMPYEYEEIPSQELPVCLNQS